MLINELHSDKLKSIYGQINIQLIKQNDLIRVALLKDSYGVTRTFAITCFSKKKYPSEIQTLDDKVRNGGLIGETIMTGGFDILRTPICNFQILEKEFPMLGNSDTLYGQVSELFIKLRRNNKEFYAETCEIFCSNLYGVHKSNHPRRTNLQLIKKINTMMEYAEITNIRVTLIN